MSYPAQVFNVMIASPSDVAAERGLVREIVHEWNAVHSFRRRIILQPVGWETHSSPARLRPHVGCIYNDRRCDVSRNTSGPGAVQEATARR